MRAGEAFSNTFAAAGSSSAFALLGGKYQLAGHSAAWGGGSLKVDQLMPDGATWVATALTLAADGTSTTDLPPGQYRFTLATTTAANAVLTRVPEE